MSDRRWAAGLLVFGWASVVLAAYYVVHKPLSPPFLRAAVIAAASYVTDKPLALPSLSALGPLATLAGTLVLGQLLGAWLIPQEKRSAISDKRSAISDKPSAISDKRSAISDKPSAISDKPSAISDKRLARRGRLALSVGAGLGLLGFIQLGLAAGGVFSPSLGWGLIALALAAAIWRGRLSEWRAVVTWPADRRSQGLALFCTFALGGALLRALTPPAAWDALVYHLTGPKLILAARGLTHDIDLPYLGFPQWGEMLFLWAIPLGGERAAAPMHWVFAPLTLMLLPDLLRPVAPGRAWLAAAILLSATTVVMVAGWPYVEWLLMFAVTGSALAIARWRETGVRQWLVVAGLMAGLAFGAKYTAVGAILGLGLAVAVSRIQDTGYRIQDAAIPNLQSLISNFQSPISNLTVFALAALATISPWLLKNVLLTGNPVYPFFLPGKFWDAARAFWYSRGGTGLTGWRLLIAPWEMTVRGVEGGVGYGATLGPLWLILLPALVIGWRTRPAAARRWLAILLVISGVAYAVWLAQVASSALLLQSRLLLGVFPILACLAAAAFDGLARISSAQLRTRWLIGGVVGFVLLLTGTELAGSLLVDNPLPVLTGRQTESDYLVRKLGWYALAMEQINALPPASDVVFLWEPRSFHCTATCEPDALLDRWWHLRRRGGDAASIAARWRTSGVTHVLIFELGRAAVQDEGFDPLTTVDWAALETLRTRELTLAADLGGVYQLYELK